VPFDLQEDDEALSWVMSLRKGVLSLDYLNTDMNHEARYRLDLAVDSDRALALKLLERLLTSQSHAAADADVAPGTVVPAPSVNTDVSGCDIINATYDGAAVDLQAWLRRSQTDCSSLGVVESHWRLPLMGVFEFDFVTHNPCFVHSEAYRIDLARHASLARLPSPSLSHASPSPFPSPLPCITDSRPSCCARAVPPMCTYTVRNGDAVSCDSVCGVQRV
jgi:hypothetical protein